MRFIAFDIETTGTVPGVDRIVELGAVRFQDGTVDSIFSTLINPGIPMPAVASRINGITDEMLVGKPKIESILEAFTEFCERDPLVAHNAPFDSQFLIADYKKHTLPTPSGFILDTLPMARKVFPGLANYKLGTLVQHLKLSTENAFHRAEEDATYCGQVFLGILEKLKNANGYPPIENLLTLSASKTNQFPFIERQPKQLGFFE